MRKFAVLMTVGLVFGTVLGACNSSAEAPRNPLPCDEFQYALGDPVSGHDSQIAALRSSIGILNSMGLSKDESIAAETAFDQRVGKDRYEAGTLYLDDVPVALLEPQRLDDGSFVVSKVTTCAPG